MKKTIFILFLMGLFYNCKTERSKAGDSIRQIDVLQNLNSHTIEDLVKSIRVIPLETNKLSLIKQVRQIKAIGDDWYVYDFNDVPLKRFSQDGRFLTQVGNKGQGPKEFIQITGFSVAEDSVTIFAWSGNRKWIRMRNDNTPLYETDMSFPFDECYKLNNTDYLFHVGNGNVSNECSHYLYWVDENYCVKKRYFPKVAPYDIQYSSFQQFFSTGSDGDILYMKEYDHTIYSINQFVEITPKYLLDFGKSGYSPKVLNDYYKKEFMDIHKEFTQRAYPRFFAFSESPDHFLFKYTRQHENVDVDYLSLYAKEKQQTYNFKIAKGSFSMLLANVQEYTKNRFYSFVTASDFLDVVSSLDGGSPFHQNLQRIAEKVTEDDNPLLVLFEFK